eukprot:71338_1
MSAFRTSLFYPQSTTEFTSMLATFITADQPKLSLLTELYITFVFYRVIRTQLCGNLAITAWTIVLCAFVFDILLELKVYLVDDWTFYVKRNDVARYRKSHSSVDGAYYRWVDHGRSEECAICYRSFGTSESILFVCGHRFCTHCVEQDRIQRKVYKCALCRRVMNAPYYRYKFNEINFSTITTAHVPRYGWGSPFHIIVIIRHRVICIRPMLQFVIRALCLVADMLKYSAYRTQSAEDISEIDGDIV